MAKGAQGERDVSRDLSLWWTNHERDDCIWRSSGSGARWTTRAKSGVSTANSVGDFSALDPIAKPLFDLLVIENKIGYTKAIDVLGVIDTNKRNILEEWWIKVEKERVQAKRHYSWVIFKRTRKNRCIMTSQRFVNQISLELYATRSIPRSITFPTDQLMRIMDFNEFLAWCSPEAIKKLLSTKGEL
jgi:hypothetical protein